MAQAPFGENPHEESIKVCCRFRPENQLERGHNGRICVEVPEGGTVVHVPATDHSFVFDRVFRWDAHQKEVYDYAAKPIINAVLRGFNGTVFAYGQTSSGKTYTMEGPDIEDKVYQGVIPRMVWSIFDGIYHADEHIEFLVKVSIVEIYNERIRDLLDPTKDNLKVHEDKARGVFIGGVTESYVGCEQEIFDAMRAGHFNRSIAVTNMNEHSSRSHLVFMLTVEQKNLHDRSVKVGKLHLVDLAGSEKVAKTGASGERLDEAKNINRSLSALGNVINALTDKKYTHVPYRDSKLTRVLQESLGGNAKTSLIITCSPSNFNEQETLSTLRFGQRAKMIKNVVKVNHERSAEELKLLLEKKDFALAETGARVVMLEQLLRAHNISVPEAHSGAAAAPVQQAASAEEMAELQDQIQEMRDQLKTKAEKVTELNRERDDLVSMMRSLEEKLSDAKLDREQIEYDRNERVDEADRLRQQVHSQRQELQELRRGGRAPLQGAEQTNGVNHGSQSSQQGGGSTAGDASSAIAAARGGGGGGGSAGDQSGGPTESSVESGLALSQCGGASASTVAGASVNSSVGASGEARAAELDRLREADRPLKRKVSQLDKNLEQLTVMYHKLVAQNSGLKVEVSENDKKIQRKDQRIGQLEKNLREAKQKYEKLLAHCCSNLNVNSTMDEVSRAKAAAEFGAGNNASVNSVTGVRRSNIVRPVRGGVATSRHEGTEVAASGGGPTYADVSPAPEVSHATLGEALSTQKRRENSRTRLKGTG